MSFERIVQRVTDAYHQLESYANRTGMLKKDLKLKLIDELQLFPNCVKHMEKFLLDVGEIYEDDPDSFDCRMPITMDIFRKALIVFLTSVESEHQSHHSKI